MMEPKEIFSIYRIYRMYRTGKILFLVILTTFSNFKNKIYGKQYSANKFYRFNRIQCGKN